MRVRVRVRVSAVGEDPGRKVRRSQEGPSLGIWAGIIIIIIII